MHTSIVFVSTLAMLTRLTTAAPSFKQPAPYRKKSAQVSPEPLEHLDKRTAGGVRMSTGEHFTGHVWYGVEPLDTCIALNYYAGKVLSFRPDEGTECYLMQGECNGEEDFADLYNDSTDCGTLGQYSWITNVQSYMCMTPIEPFR